MSKKCSLRIVFIAYTENSLGRRIISKMIGNNIFPIHVFMASLKATSKWRRKSILRYFKRTSLFDTVWRIIYRLTLRKDIKKSSTVNNSEIKFPISHLSKTNKIPIGYFDNVNSVLFREKLLELKPDLIVLGGSPILKKEILEIPKIAVLNSHPGILPFAKGTDVVSQSILHEIPLGVSVFKVNEGIDSGPLLITKYLEDSICGLKLHEIEAKIEELCSIAMIEGIKKIESGNYEFMSQNGEGNLFRPLNYRTYKKIIRKLSII